MGPDSTDLAATLSSISAEAERTGTSEFVHQLIQFILHPSTVSADTILRAAEHLAVASVSIANFLALLGAIFFVVTLLARTIVPLRISAIISDVFFVGYGVMAASFTTFLLYTLLLPINILRLYQMVKLVKKARLSARGNLSMDWLKPFMARRNYRQGDFLCRKGEAANEMFFTVSGKFLVAEIGVELPEGQILGELGFLSPDNQRTHSVQCIADGTVLVIKYDKLLELYFQNPEFGYYFLRLTSERLLQNNSRLEKTVADYKARLEAVTAQQS
jgi:hypothetical protein